MVALDSNDVIITGYPRSGSVWLTRMVSDILDSPVPKFPSMVSLALADDKPGPYRVYQLHMRPVLDGGVETNSVKLSVPKWNGEKIIHIIRDVRDVIISCMHFWDMHLHTIEEAIEDAAVREEFQHGVGNGGWANFVQSWLDIDGVIPVQTIFYEKLLVDPEILHTALKNAGLPCDTDVVKRAYKYRHISMEKQRAETNGDNMVWGKKDQLHHLRNGKSGEWREVFNANHIERINELFGPLLERLGYKLDG